ncbi:cysteine hydrolase family protein [Siccirubricoccus phaeus]|uniref:cysteine hydrolase family protein n=1 Tax=Siccirubricoccus phaeus TaxID=2595053 RepID=UPI0011F3F298|nr:isochorismatase family cysteine hydrolase [Siccirubricoccus phaeus]
MLVIDGHEVFTEMHELVDPAHTAVVVIDPQNDFCSEGGVFARGGKDMSAFPAAIAAAAKLVDRARAAGCKVIFIQNQKLPDGKSTSPGWLRFMALHNKLDPNDAEMCLVGSWGAEFVPGLQPEPPDIIVQKWRSSAFVGTNLDMILRVHRIRTVVCCGFVTQGCVESTARDAGFYDYYPVVVEDAIATHDQKLHEASLTVQRTRYDVVPSEVVLAEWEKKTPQLA